MKKLMIILNIFILGVLFISCSKENIQISNKLSQEFTSSKQVSTTGFSESTTPVYTGNFSQTFSQNELISGVFTLQNSPSKQLRCSLIDVNEENAFSSWLASFWHTSGRPSYDIYELNSVYKVAEVRKIDEETYYCIYKSDQGKTFVVFTAASISEVFTIKENLSFADFTSLKVDKSSKSDVIAIDPATNFNIKCAFFSQYKIYNSKEFSVHFTKEGYVAIEYKTVNNVQIISKINKVDDEVVKSINSLDLQSTRG